MEVPPCSQLWPECDPPEPSLDEKPLEFLLEHASDPSAWKPLVWDESRRCFAFHLPDAFEPSLRQHFFERIRDTAPWQPLQDKTKTKISRHTAWYTRNAACNCAYTYGEDTRVEATKDKDKEFRSVMDSLTACVFSKFPGLQEETWPNCANVNLYGDGDAGVGWHADDELIFMGTARDCPILSLSLGGTREFWVALKSDIHDYDNSAAPDVRKGVVEMDVRDGDLMTMEGFMQKHTMHCVPRSCPSDPLRNQPRINVTFRWMRVHKQECPYAKVAQTWFMLSGSSPKAEAVCTDCGTDAKEGSVGTPTKNARKQKRGVVTIFDPVTGKQVENASLSRANRQPSKKDRVAILSPLPPSSRLLFGEGTRETKVGLPRPSGSPQFLLQWSTGSGTKDAVTTSSEGGSSAVRWVPCDGCGHVSWGGGRPCRSSGDQWFCRCCWQRWAEEDAAAGAYQDPLALPAYAEHNALPLPFYDAWAPPFGAQGPFSAENAAAYLDPQLAMLAHMARGAGGVYPGAFHATAWPG